MIETPAQAYHSDTLSALRGLFSQQPEAIVCGTEELANRLRAERLVPRRVFAHEVEAALEALRVEGEVVA